jgi:hypothetical protein
LHARREHIATAQRAGLAAIGFARAARAVREPAGELREVAAVVVRVDPAVLRPEPGREAGHQLVRHERHIHHAAHALATVLARRQLDVTGVVALGFLGIQAYGAAHRVAPEESALRAAQYFHAIDIQNVEHRAEHGGVIHVVDIEAHARRIGEQEVSLPDTADERLIGFAEPGAAEAHRHVRRRSGDVQDVLHAALFDHLGRDGRDGDGRLLKVLGFVLRGDHHFLQYAHFGTGVLSLGRSVAWKQRPREHGDGSEPRDRRCGALLDHLNPLPLVLRVPDSLCTDPTAEPDGGRANRSETFTSWSRGPEVGRPQQPRESMPGRRRRCTLARPQVLLARGDVGQLEICVSRHVPTPQGASPH